VPLLPVKSGQLLTGPGAPAGQVWQNALLESVDAVRTRLLHDVRSGGMQVIMITSAMGSEGKTTLASQLAASLARAWRKTLLVDGDLRNPAAHQLFSLSLEPGFCEVLRGEAVHAEAIKPTPLSRLWLMPAGQWDGHAVQALAQDKVGSMFDELKEHYDFIIVDSCPVLALADALLLGQHVDGVVFSIFRDVSRTPLVHTAQQMLQGIEIRILGGVVIGCSNGAKLAREYAGRIAS
jgi:capsular exopolysaccharide synthesis family protein